ncbi:MAG: MotA/TolQ/ExbB proton channel family protein [Verrucomicrobiota bacterium JB025]|nr:MotA/TolQ/ExbB proton channel family protein [Verrucomicrobiota bacterium JB025]
MRFAFRFLLPFAFAGVVCGQSATDKKLADAREQLEATRNEYTAMRRALYREINKLDDEALEFGRELRGLEKEAARRSANAMNLKREIEARETEFNYAVGVLGNYSGALLTRVHPAENQLYRSRLEEATARAGASLDDPEAELGASIVAAEVGLERLRAVIGGHRFDGEALRNGTEATDGSLLVYGPSVYMAAKDGSFEGVATFAESGTALPTVVALSKEAVAEGTIAKAIHEGAGELPFDPTMGKAIQVLAAHETIGETIEKGGVVGYAILILGLIAVGLTVFKAIEIMRFPVPSRRLINEIIDDLLADDQKGAMAKASRVGGMSGKMVKTGVEQFYEKRRVLEEALFEKLVVVKPRLERFLPFLGLTAAAAPLMGLLGTVLGIIKTFKAMALYGSGNQKAFTQGISEALITTAEGLVVAIPVLVLHGIMRSLAKGKFNEVEGVAIALMNGTTELDKRGSEVAPKKEVTNNDEPEDEDPELVSNPA